MDTQVPPSRRALMYGAYLLLASRPLVFAMGISLPAITAFWRSHDMSILETYVLQAIFAVAIVGFEVPTGHYADRRSRHLSLRIGGAAMCVGELIYSFSHGFWQFLAAELTLALALSCISGADISLFVELIREAGADKKEEERLLGWYGTVEFMMMMVISIVGFLLADWNIRSLMRIAAASSLIFFAATWFIPTPSRPAARTEKTWKAFLASLDSGPDARWILLFGGFYTAWLQVSLWAYEPMMKLLGSTQRQVALMFAVFQAVAFLFSFFASPLEKKFGFRRMMYLIVGLLGSAYLVTVATSSILALPLFQVCRGLARNLLLVRVQEVAPMDLRATFSSTFSLCSRLAYSATLIPVGLLLQFQGLESGFVLMGVVVLTVGIILLSRQPSAA